MSNERWLGFVSAEVATDPRISTAAKAVYLVLAVHADRDGYCWPSIGTITTAMGCSRSTTKRALKELQDRGVIKSDSRHYESTGRQRSNGYTLLDISTRKKGGGVHP